ncbi:siderophore-interacting protein [Gilliamella apicola]|uniref:siderophore-interacting protein n=1 Tax=Gilliamella apicola TaxID=1196095 RepID=UPI002FEDFA95
MTDKPQKSKKLIVNALLTVLKVEKISPSFIRVQFSSNKPFDVDSAWVCPHVKLLFPEPITGEILFPKLDEDNKIVVSDKVRQLARSYSVREFDSVTNQLFIDFAIHESGLATVWSRHAKVGDQIGLVGSAGKLSFTDNCLVLMGDISAAPAICYTLEHLPEKQKVYAFVLVNHPKDIVPLPDNENVQVNWLIQDNTKPNQLVDVVINTEFAEQDKLMFWGGMESSLAQQLRRALKDKYTQLAPEAIHITSYWREGFAEGEFKHRD